MLETSTQCCPNSIRKTGRRKKYMEKTGFKEELKNVATVEQVGYVMVY